MQTSPDLCQRDSDLCPRDPDQTHARPHCPKLFVDTSLTPSPHPWVISPWLPKDVAPLIELIGETITTIEHRTATGASNGDGSTMTLSRPQPRPRRQCRQSMWVPECATSSSDDADDHDHDEPPRKRLAAAAAHDPGRAYGCTLCEWRFSRSDELQRHMRSHTNERPFACSICPKTFARSDHRQKHERIHARGGRIR